MWFGAVVQLRSLIVDTKGVYDGFLPGENCLFNAGFLHVALVLMTFIYLTRKWLPLVRR